MALPRGMHRLLASLSTKPELYTLVTVPLLTKYSGWSGALQAHSRVGVSRLASRLGWGNTGETGVVVVSGLNQYRAALNAMLEHKSQMVWFRWLYVSFSRYMWVNEWVRVHAG